MLTICPALPLDHQAASLIPSHNVELSPIPSGGKSMPISVESPVVLPPAHTPPSESSIELDPASIASRHEDEVTVAAAIAAEKTRLRQQSAIYDKILDKWLAHHNQNLYPTREEKERLAAEMNISYTQVNRWFANRRRKQTKQRSKVVLNSPASVTPTALPAALTHEVVQRMETPPPSATEPSSTSFLTPESLALFAHALSAQAGRSGSGSLEERLQQVAEAQNHASQSQTQAHQNPQQQQQQQVIGMDAATQAAQRRVEEMLAAQTQRNMAGQQQLGGVQHSPMAEMNTNQQAQVQEMLKLLSLQALGGQTNPAYSQLILAMLQMQNGGAAAHIQAVLQAQQVVQQHLIQQQLAAAIVNQQQQQTTPQHYQQTVTAQTQSTQRHAPTQTKAHFHGGSISASPAVSELSELSPRSPSNSLNRPQSPPFKDPQNLADPSMMRLLNLNQLSEKEQMAVTVLAGLPACPYYYGSPK